MPTKIIKLNVYFKFYAKKVLKSQHDVIKNYVHTKVPKNS